MLKVARSQLQGACPRHIIRPRHTLCLGHACRHVQKHATRSGWHAGSLRALKTPSGGPSQHQRPPQPPRSAGSEIKPHPYPDACRNRCVCSPGTTQVVRHCAPAPIQRCAAHRESLAWPLHLLSMAKPGVTACDSQDCSSHRCACPGIDCMCAWSLCSRERMVLQVVQSLGQVEQGRWLLHCCPSYVESMPEVHACQQNDFENET